MSRTLNLPFIQSTRKTSALNFTEAIQVAMNASWEGRLAPAQDSQIQLSEKPWNVLMQLECYATQRGQATLPNLQFMAA